MVDNIDVFVKLDKAKLFDIGSGEKWTKLIEEAKEAIKIAKSVKSFALKS